MDRRNFLAATGTVVATAALAGCGGSGGGGITGGLEIADVTAETTSFGNVDMQVVVENTAGSEKSGTLRGVVDVEGGDTYEQTRSVTVSANSDNSYRLKFDIALSESLSADAYEYSAEIQ